MKKRLKEIKPAATAPVHADDPGMVTALARGLDVLRAFRRSDRYLGNQDLALRTGLAKATVSRLTYTLSRLGYLAYHGDIGKYSLGGGVLGLGFTCLGAMGIRDIARPLMAELAAATGVTVALGTADQFSMVYVECCRGDGMVHLALDVGSHIKMATSAIGRAYIAALPAAERAALIERLAEREGERWPEIAAGLDRAARDLTRQGFVLSLGEWQEQVNAVGVPLTLGSGSLAFALNCGGPAYLVPKGRLTAEIGPQLVATAGKIRAAMGG